MLIFFQGEDPEILRNYLSDVIRYEKCLHRIKRYDIKLPISNRLIWWQIRYLIIFRNIISNQINFSKYRNFSSITFSFQSPWTNSVLCENSVLNPFQFGFRPVHSAGTVLVKDGISSYFFLNLYHPWQISDRNS